MGLLMLMGDSGFNVRSELFGAGEQGAWYDPSDFSTMWQDSGKTTPVTAAGDPVGYISDKSGRGNHAFQTTSASRPTLARIPSSGRRNLLNHSEQLDNAAWTTVQCSISANNSTAPDGSSTADLILENGATASRYAQQSLTTTVQTYTFSIYLKNPTLNGRRYALLYHNESVKGWAFDLQNGVVGVGGTVGVTAPAAYGIESVGSGWYRCYITITGTAASNQFRVYPLNNDGSGAASYAGDSVSGILAWGAQLETGSTATSYQKVVATTDVTQSGVSDLWHLVFDGSDDSLVTNALDFTATDEMTVIAGVRKLSDAARGTICELTATIASNNGAFHLTAPNAASATYAFESKGTALTDTVASSVTAPITSVVSGASDISGDANVIRVNGTQSDSDTGDQGTGNYSNSAIFIGRRNQATLPFTGHIYQLIIRGRTTPTGKLLEAERFVGKKTGVTF